MRGTVVGVLRGGPSKEHEVSLASGAAVLSALSPEHFTVRDIYIDKQGQWHERGRAMDPADVLRTMDAVLIALHGEYGEDGEVQKVLERAGVPYTGSDSFGSFIAMHKVMAKEKAKQLGIRTADYRYIESLEQMEPVLQDVVRSFMQPVVVKPVRWGSSVGVSLVTGYAPLHDAVSKLLHEGAGGVLIEEFIKGTEATSGVVENLRGEALYALPSVEIIPPHDASFFTYDAKYSGATRELTPGRFPKNIQKELADSARAMHQALGLRHYSRSDFIVSPKGVYYLETNTLPGLTRQSLLPKSLEAIGVSFSDFLFHLIDLAMGEK
jgi:D-alanine-D-alanine ligase